MGIRLFPRSAIFPVTALRLGRPERERQGLASLSFT